MLETTVNLKCPTNYKKNPALPKNKIIKKPTLYLCKQAADPSDTTLACAVSKIK